MYVYVYVSMYVFALKVLIIQLEYCDRYNMYYVL